MTLILMALKHCKKIICTLLIMIMLIIPGKAFADTQYKIDLETKEGLLKQSQIMNWNEFDRIMYRGSRFIVVDYKTGIYWIAERHMGGSHADIECVDEQSSENKNLIMQEKDWRHRPVLIVFEDGRVYCASSFIKDHCGVDNEPYLKQLEDLSGGYKNKQNYDKIKNNGQEGHNCIHVRKSRNHFDGKISEKHQNNIDWLMNEKSKIR